MKLDQPVQLTPSTTQVVLEDTETNRYVISFEQGDNLMLVCGQDARKPIVKTLHSLIVKNKMTCSGQINTIMEFKHYRNNGSKFWNSSPGVMFYYCVPKSQIKVLPIQGMSYVHIEINGVEVVLNVGGGTTYDNTTGKSGWEDWVHNEAHTLVGMPLKKMKAIAEVAIPAPTPEGIKMLEGKELDRWNQMVNKQDHQALVMKAIEEGKRPQIVLAEGFSYNGGQTTGVVDSVTYGKKSKEVPCDEKDKALGYKYKVEWVPTKRVKSLLIDSGGYPRYIAAKPTQIDWEKSAALLS